jgi:opacity protein-like surface antigen
MKRLILTSALLAFLAPSAAQAQFYAGGGYEATSLAYRGSWNGSEPQHFDGYALRLGDRFTRYLALEASAETGAGNDGADHFAMRTAALDAIIYYPIFDGPFSAFASLGGAYSQAQDRNIVVTRTYTLDPKTQKTIVTRDVVLTPHFSGSETDWRSGAGIECALTQSTALRLGLRYQPTAFHGRFEGSYSATIGFNIAL